MPILNRLFPRHADSEGKLSPNSPKSPRWPRSPKSPKSPKYPKPLNSPKPLTWTERNPDYLNQCVGCNNVDRLIRLSSEQHQGGGDIVPWTVLHNSFEELESCAQRCEICRVFRQSLYLEEVTFDGAKKIRDAQGEVVVRWRETTATNDSLKAFLTVEVEGAPERVGVVNCNSRSDEVAHLSLRPDGRDATVIEQAKEWLSTCLDDHIGQCDNLKFSSERPKLLIEILSPKMIRLCDDQEGDYVALSYCWGNPKTYTSTQCKKVEEGKTKLDNLKRRHQPFSVDELPTTVSDALYIIHAMGLRYAWIDTLCIVQDKPEGVATMHKVYSNALFTLCSCATTQATASLLGQREAWTQRTEPCRLGGQWLTTSDMSLNELRLRSPLAERAWTLQEERLSPRMLYVSSSRMHWSCAVGHQMEMKPTYDQKATKSQRPVYAASDRDTQMPPAQEFLLACYNSIDRIRPLHYFWADIIKSYALRDMTNPKDRLTALSGLAAKYFSANSGDDYLAGLWAKNLPEGLVWKVDRALEINRSKVDPEAPQWPSWSWAALPVQSAIKTHVMSARSPFFQLIEDDNIGAQQVRIDAEEAVKRGEQIKDLCVTGRMRHLWGPSSRRIDWATSSRYVGGEERFTFATNPEQNMHAIDSESGRVLVYEDRKKEVVGQLDFRHDLERLQSEWTSLCALEIGETTMLLLQRSDQGTWRRVGVAWDVRKGFFERADPDVLLLR